MGYCASDDEVKGIAKICIGFLGGDEKPSVDRIGNFGRNENFGTKILGKANFVIDEVRKSHYSVLESQGIARRVNDVKRDSQLPYVRFQVSVVRPPVPEVHPLLHLGFLQLDGLKGSVSGTFSLVRLPANNSGRDECYEYQGPIGPFRGCIPLWRLLLCGACFVAGAILFCKGNGRIAFICAIACYVGGGLLGFAPWGRYDCQTGRKYCDIGDLPDSHRPINVSQKYLTELYFCNTFIHMANTLSTDKQIAVISALAEGSSIRSIERMTGIHRDTIMRLGVRVGKSCEMLMDSKMQDLGCRYLQFDELWGFIGKKERHVKIEDGPECGDVWTFCAIDSETKLVPSFRVGKRDAVTANAFVQDVASRMRNRVQISTDALRAYVEAVEQSFGGDVDYGQIVKVYVHDSGQHPERKYSAPDFASAVRRAIVGDPEIELVSTSHVERLNATTRLHVKRLSRLTLAFSKKLENFKAAVALHFAYYNFVKRHNTIRCTPAMAAGIEKDFWTVEDLVKVAA